MWDGIKEGRHESVPRDNTVFMSEASGKESKIRHRITNSPIWWEFKWPALRISLSPVLERLRTE